MTELINQVTTEKEMLAGIRKMNRFGIRLTGTKAQNDFIRYLKREINKMGMETYCDPYFFRRWEEKKKGLWIHDGLEIRPVHISSAFPYSGETPEGGVTAPLQFVQEKHVGFVAAKDKIAVVNIEELDFLPSTIAFHKRRAMPETADIPDKYDGPVATSFINFPFLQTAKDAGCKGVICIWRSMSNEMIEGQYLPFILSYFGIPAVWVNSSDGDRLIEDAKQGKTATLELVAEKEENAFTESFCTIIPGKNTAESIIINTHTDGTNCIEENGPIAMLPMMKYFKENPPERTLVFVFVTGHFRLPSFKSQDGGGVQATSKWLASHRDLWDGKAGHMKAVACVSIEHLGCKRFKDVDGKYQQVGDVETELVYTGNKKLDNLYFECLEGREQVNTLTLRGHNFLHFGEGQPPFNCGIPEISIVTAPDCLTVISDNHEMDKFDIHLMFEQSDTFLRIINRLQSMTRKEIGTVDGYSLVFPNGEPLIYRTVKGIIRKAGDLFEKADGKASDNIPFDDDDESDSE